MLELPLRQLMLKLREYFMGKVEFGEVSRKQTTRASSSNGRPADSRVEFAAVCGYSSASLQMFIRYPLSFR
jgi:hypothetical protein